MNRITALALALTALTSTSGAVIAHQQAWALTMPPSVNGNEVSDKNATTANSAMDHSAMDHSAMDHSAVDHSAVDPSAMDHEAARQHHHTPRGRALRTPIPPPTPAEIAAAFPTLHDTAMHHPHSNRYLLLDRLEGWDRSSGSGQAWEAKAWIGGDIDRLWLRSEGERSGGRTESARLEALYGHTISPWWDLLIGVRHDFRPGGNGSWAALGVQGLTPYKFEFSATLYVGEHSDSALKLESEYDVLLSNRLILQPRLEADIAFADDRVRGIGSGLDTVETGLRLRYEISRRFAPYLGWEHRRRFGEGADAARARGEPARDSRFVAGLRFWF